MKACGDAWYTERNLQPVDELKKYRMDVPQVTMLADALIQKGVPLPKGILRREELVDALCQLS